MALIQEHTSLPSGKAQVAVVMDPHLSKVLRPHQFEGVQFLYNCVMGISNRAHRGAILADEMGLGKTLQTISLVWTLLKDGPEGTPAVKKAIVVTPSSLTKNWQAEFKKWLGTQRTKPIVLSSSDDQTQQKDDIREFAASSIRPVLIISYEMFRKHLEVLQSLKSGQRPPQLWALTDCLVLITARHALNHRVPLAQCYLCATRATA